MGDMYSTEKYSDEFWQWYDKVYLQDPNITHYRYDDEKMYQAWKAGVEYGKKSSEPKKIVADHWEMW